MFHIGAKWLLGLYFCALLGAAALAPCIYQIIKLLSCVFDWHWAQYLYHKPINQYIDRLRLIFFFALVLFYITKWKWWNRFQLHFGFQYYFKSLVCGCLLWITLFVIIAGATKPIFHFENIWIGPFIASFCIAFLEEMVFRGFVWDVLRQKHTQIQSIGILTLIFASLHFSLCRSGSCESLWGKSFECAYFSIIDIPQNIQWTYFLCLCALNIILVHLRVRDKTLWSCIGFHQGLVFTLMVFRKNFWFNTLQSSWWGTGRLTDAWFVVVVLAFICGLIYRKASRD